MFLKFAIGISLAATMVFVDASYANHITEKPTRFYFIAKQAAEKFDYNTALINYRRALDHAVTKCDAVFSLAGIKAAKQALEAQKQKRDNIYLENYFNEIYENEIIEARCDLSGEV
ncbi:MAG TPA: hypothetical protein V6D15_05275 [Oculatellaceae cyanobacterium]|jgi:hypothetical protein